MDYERVRESSAEFSAVEVNHRALITRTLTKYSVEYALFRELLQNSADAQASSAKIKFETAVSLEEISNVHSAPISRLIFTNDGAEFNEQDWSRLKEIARGNPNESKIGAFGVGFYSVFELSDVPIVHSGDSIMSFGYKGDQLQYARVQGEFFKGTLIDLPYRTRKRIGNLVNLTAFLVRSLTFVPLQDVEVWINDVKLLSIQKLALPNTPLEISADMKKSSPNGSLKLKRLVANPVKMVITYLNGSQITPPALNEGLINFGRRLISLVTQSSKAEDYTVVDCLFTRIDAVADVKVNNKFRKRMVETVMKPPPQEICISMLSCTEEERKGSNITSPLRDYIFPPTVELARIFIGFPTKQDTGLRSHVAINQLIPTMERTSVDMCNAFIKDWNSQLLYMAGVLSRCVYEHELSLISNSKLDLPAKLSATRYTMERFEFGPSTPDAEISRCIQAGFWKSSAVMLLPTQQGIKPSDKVRLPYEETPFIKHTPLFLLDMCSHDFAMQLNNLEFVKRITIAEMAKDIELAPLSTSDFLPLIKWLVGMKEVGRITSSQIQQILLASVVSGEKYTVSLGAARYFQVSSLIPVGLPVPSTCLPAELVDKVPLSYLLDLNWSILKLVDWVQFIASDACLKDPDFSVTLNQGIASKVLQTLSGQWDQLEKNERGQIKGIMANISCIPTQLGTTKPSQAYIKKIPLFSDLPVVLDTISASKRFLFDLGLRASIDMQVALQQIQDASFNWSNEDLTDYLAKNKNLLKAADWEILRSGDFFEPKNGGVRVKASELYEPDATLEKLGFSVLDWPGEFVKTGHHRELLETIGLKVGPPARELFVRAQCIGCMPEALTFYIENYERAKYNGNELRQLGFAVVPCASGNVVQPGYCYIDQEAELFGLEVISASYVAHASKFGVKQNPPISVLLQRLLEDPPATMEVADRQFSYLSTRLAEFTQADFKRCLSSRFIPVGTKQWKYPFDVFLSAGDATELSELFHIITASPASSAFLLRVGVKSTPSIEDITLLLVNEPSHIYNMVGGGSKYKKLLLKVYTSWPTVSRNEKLIQKMRTAKCLLGIHYSDEENEPSFRQCSADELVIVDNEDLYSDFKSYIDSAPQDQLLEDLYMRLGVQKVSQAIKETIMVGKKLETFENLEQKQSHIRERLRLFLESTTKERQMRPVDASNITLVPVGSLNIKRTLPGIKEKCAVTTAFSGRGYMLYITPDPDWFDVARALIVKAMKKPDPDSAIVLEVQLSRDLAFLRRKGYNVTRLLKRQEELQEEKRRDTQMMADALENSVNAHKAKALADSSDKTCANAQANLFEQLQAQEQKQMDRSISIAKAPIDAKKNPLDKHPSPFPSQPPPYSAHDAQTWESEKGIQSLPTRPGSLRNVLKGRIKSMLGLYAEPPGNSHGLPANTNSEPQTQMSVNNIDETLRAGIRVSKPYTQNEVDRDIDKVDAPEPPSFCSQIPRSQLFLAATVEGMQLYIQRGTTLTSADRESATRLEPVLRDCAEIFDLNCSALSMFAGRSSLIAFNLDGSLFFNVNAEIPSSPGRPPMSPLDFWFPVMAHELAHNLVKSHGARHSFYTESFIQSFLPTFRLALT